MSKKSFRIPIVGREWYVVVRYDKDAFDFKGKGAGVHARTYLKSGANPIIILPHKPKTPDEIGVMAHEVTHAISHIYEELDEDNSDRCHLYSYFVGIVVQKILESK